jgi:hypothetical protein
MSQSIQDALAVEFELEGVYGALKASQEQIAIARCTLRLIAAGDPAAWQSELAYYNEIDP